MTSTKRTVLLIDDDKDFILSTKVFLEGRGYLVETASNGGEGWEKIQKQKIDLIVLDVMMETDAEGFHLAFKLKDTPETRHIPIIIVSGFTQHMEEKMDQFEFVLNRQWPASAQMEKPIQLKELAKTIERLLDQGEAK